MLIVRSCRTFSIISRDLGAKSVLQLGSTLDHAWFAFRRPAERRRTRNFKGLAFWGTDLSCCGLWIAESYVLVIGALGSGSPLRAV